MQKVNLVLYLQKKQKKLTKLSNGSQFSDPFGEGNEDDEVARMAHNLEARYVSAFFLCVAASPSFVSSKILCSSFRKVCKIVIFSPKCCNSYGESAEFCILPFSIHALIRRAVSLAGTEQRLCEEQLSQGQQAGHYG